jgi:monodechloroaminopyrrolnitrin synthase
MSTVLLPLENQSILSRQNREDAYIASLDPLPADEPMSLLPVLNRKEDTIALVLMLVDILPYMSAAEAFDSYQANAAIRDIGFLLGSLKRHKIEPVNVIPDLEEKLNVLAGKTNLPPRDTLLHYTVWNPPGIRQRTYTGRADESHLIQSVRLAMNPLVAAIYDLQDLHAVPVDSLDFVSLCEKVTANYAQMVTGIVHAKRNVSPQVFAQDLRFYFDPVLLNGTEYLGPGAVEMPVFVFDHLLWGSDCTDEMYNEFKTTYLPYIHPHVLRVYQHFVGRESMVSKVVRGVNEQRFSSPANALASVKALIRLFTQLKSFRMPHKKLADEAYAHSDTKQREKGSGGYEPQILAYLLQLTVEHLMKLEECLLRLKWTEGKGSRPVFSNAGRKR